MWAQVWRGELSLGGEVYGLRLGGGGLRLCWESASH